MTANRWQQGRHEGGTACIPSAKSPAPRVLLAEDDSDMRSMLAWALRTEGCEVTECPDGITVLSLLEENGRGEQTDAYDVLISDIRMPGLTALEILELLPDPADHPPAILITAFGDEATHEEAIRLGAAAVVDKPFELDMLIAKVHELTLANTKPNEQTDNDQRE